MKMSELEERKESTHGNQHSSSWPERKQGKFQIRNKTNS